MTSVHLLSDLPDSPSTPHSDLPPRNAEEERFLSHLRDARPELLGTYLALLDQGRRGILHRLLQAVIREDVAGVASRTTWDADGSSVQIALSGGRTIRARIGRRGSFGRIEFAGDVILEGDGRTERIEQPRRLLELVLEGTGDNVPESFGRELDNSAANYSLALVGAERRMAAMEVEARGSRTSLDWVENRLRSDPEFNPLVFYEQWVVDGHPLHPGAKIKLGMEPEDVIRYAPEWGARPGLALVAVARRVCRVAAVGEEGASDILLREHPELQAVVEESLEHSGHRLDDFELIPVHPWQLEHTLPRVHAGAIARGEVVPIPGAVVPAAALVSVRSMATLGPRSQRRHHVKSALAVQMTNAVRTVSPQAAENGPMLTRILAEIQTREGRFDGQFAVLREDVGVYFDPTDPGLDPEARATQSKHLAALLREGPEDHAGPGEIALPAAALTVRSPIGGAPVAVELIERFATKCGQANLQQAALDFLEAYAAVSVPGFLTLMVRYGIALEGHLQNSVTVVRLDDGRPVRMLVRDLGGVRVLPDRLTRQGFSAAFRPGSATLAKGEDDLRDKVYYAFVQNHLGELIAAVARHGSLEESTLWGPVADACRATFRRLRREPALAWQAEADESALFGPTLRLKALTQMRLRGEVTDYRFAEVPNPLAGAG